MNFNEFDNTKEAPMTPPSSPRHQDIPTVTKDTTAAQEAVIAEQNEEMWDSMKYKAVPFMGRIILDKNGVRVDNPQGIERFTEHDEKLLADGRWHRPIYNRHGENVTGRYVSMFDRVQTLPPYEEDHEILARVGPHYTESIVHTPRVGRQGMGNVPKGPSKGTKRRMVGQEGHNGGKRKRRTRNKKNNKKRSNK